MLTPVHAVRSAYGFRPVRPQPQHARFTAMASPSLPDVKPGSVLNILLRPFSAITHQLKHSPAVRPVRMLYLANKWLEDAQIQLQEGNRMLAKRRFQSVTHLYREVPQAGVPLVIRAYQGLATLAIDDKNWDKAEKFLGEAENIGFVNGLYDTEDHALTLALFGGILKEQGGPQNHARARDYLQKSITLLETLLGETDPQTLQVKAILAN